tara:strand:- start:195 stop:920 length:726 start_codon:yes stop_codon:yes gene_type:complete
MLNLNLFAKIGFFLYIIVYLISPKLAIAKITKVDIRNKLENALNARNLKLIKDNFEEEESLKIEKKFLTIIKDFPEAKWKIKKLIGGNYDDKGYKIKVDGKRILNGETYLLESNFEYIFSTMNNKISYGKIQNLLTTIRNDKNKIDIIFKIPTKVLTGKQYDIDIILNQPLGDVIIAGGIKAHQDTTLLKQEIIIEPLVTGGIFKMTRAPSKEGTQIWSGIIAHPEGMISFTKSVEIVEKI